MNTVPYRVSFTAAGSLLRQESMLVTEHFLALGNWEAAAQEVVGQNLLQSRTASSAKRIVREIISRLQCLSLEELQFLITATYRDKGYLLWLAICRCYRFFGELAVEVLHERFVSLLITFSHEDYNYFFTQKTVIDSKLASVSETTQRKLRQVTFKMLYEAELLTEDNLIVPAQLSQELIRLIISSNPNDFLYFPIFEADVARLIR